MTTHKKNQRLLKELEKTSKKPLTLGNLLWSIRKGEEWTQVEMAEKLAVSKQYICDIENGRRIISPKMAAGYAQKLGYAENQFVRLSLQDMLNKDALPFKVNVSAYKNVPLPAH